MKTDKLVDAIGMIKDEYIKEAHEKGFKKFTIPWPLIGKVLNAACVLFLVINILPFNFGSYKADYSTASGGAVAPQEANNYYYESSAAVVDDEKAAQILIDHPVHFHIVGSGTDLERLKTLANNEISYPQCFRSGWNKCYSINSIFFNCGVFQ